MIKVLLLIGFFLALSIQLTEEEMDKCLSDNMFEDINIQNFYDALESEKKCEKLGEKQAEFYYGDEDGDDVPKTQSEFEEYADYFYECYTAIANNEQYFNEKEKKEILKFAECYNTGNLDENYGQVLQSLTFQSVLVAIAIMAVLSY
ncbi:hypothetical protein PPERSA_01448 [Pseudocohnilembus persalinus]|uniref:Transmembrane protein n=1 Tax=Pseudocohnilembus persalinus TaxID=266149 RepID=A0A0V0QH47_PSEPJ|nr:hypothetical protein PPERSA_01448 [Pseudocohnilembus persalinus]|eukprot:KRX01545.1 hypothetical protein PPERSA_01448 [Pseudocohnilembus persalinus]